MNYRHNSIIGKVTFLINVIYLYDDQLFILKITVINKIVTDFMDTLYILFLV